MNTLPHPIRARRIMVQALALFALTMISVPARAADGNPPDRMTYQGYVVDASGVALGNSSPKNYDIIFRIYNDQTAGTRLWAEQQTVTVDKGYFSILLGEGSAYASESRPALSSLFSASDASDRFVEMTVKGIGASGADVTILPRLRLLTAPYAYLAKQAANAGNLVNASGSQVLTVSGTNITVVGEVTGTTIRAGAAVLSGTVSASTFTGSTANISALNAASAAISGNAHVSGTLYVGDGTPWFGPYGTTTVLNFDTGDYFQHYKSNDQLLCVLGHQEVFRVRSSGVNLATKDLYLVYGEDSNHGLGYRSSLNGPFLYGWSGGGLGAQGNVTLRWTGNRVGINTSSPQAALHVARNADAPAIYGSMNYFNYVFGNSTPTMDADGCGEVAGYFEGSLVSNNNVCSMQVTGYSDARAKTVLGRSSSAADLARLDQIQITDFRWKDSRVGLPGVQKKVIAQELEVVFPEAVSRTTKVIPSVFDKATEVTVDRECKRVTLRTGKPHDFKQGDLVDVFTDTGDLIKREVVATPSPETFTVACEGTPTSAFVYGKWVDDYRMVDYDAIAMLNVSATQELHRRLVARESEVVSLKGALSEAQGREERLEARVAELERLTRSLAAMVNPTPQAPSVVVPSIPAPTPAAATPSAAKPSNP